MIVPFEKIRTWRERIGQSAEFPLHVPTDVERAMVAEIADLTMAFNQFQASATEPAAPAASAWQPIETAPRTGWPVLLGCFNSMGHWRTMRGRWFTKEEIDQDWEESDGFEAGWYETAEEPDCPNCWPINPTHWAHTPPAPKREDREAADVLTVAARDVLAERQRQVDAEGYDHENDDAYVNDEMAAAAAFYVMPPGVRDWPMDGSAYGATMGQAIYPDWMPPKTDDRRRELVKGAALTIAEIERIDRAGALADSTGGVKS